MISNNIIKFHSYTNSKLMRLAISNKYANYS